MNFSKLKLQEGLAASGGTQTSLDASQKSSEAAGMGTQKSQSDKQMGNERLRRQRAQKADPRGAGQVFENLQKKVERIKAYESQKSDWRSDLNEKVMDGQEREQHPFVTVMPTGDENLIQAMKQMGKGVKEKKDDVKEDFVPYDTGKNEKLERKAKKKESTGDDNDKDKAHTMRAVNNLMTKADYYEKSDQKRAETQIKKHKEQGEANSMKFSKTLDDKDYDKAVTNFRRARTLKMANKAGKQFEEVELEEEKKKKCKEGYKRDEDGNCVKEKKSKTNIIIGRGWGYGHDHDHDDSDNESDGGEAGGGGGDGGGGGMGEMFDALGDMLLKEKLETGPEYHDRMKKNRKPINQFPVNKNKAANKQRKQADSASSDTRSDSQKMFDATGPRKGSNYRGD